MAALFQRIREGWSARQAAQEANQRLLGVTILDPPPSGRIAGVPIPLPIWSRVIAEAPWAPGGVTLRYSRLTTWEILPWVAQSAFSLLVDAWVARAQAVARERRLMPEQYGRLAAASALLRQAGAPTALVLPGGGVAAFWGSGGTRASQADFTAALTADARAVFGDHALSQRDPAWRDMAVHNGLMVYGADLNEAIEQTVVAIDEAALPRPLPTLRPTKPGSIPIVSLARFNAQPFQRER